MADMSPKSRRRRRRSLYSGQEGRCTGCYDPLSPSSMTLHHLLPRADGGTHTLENLELLCPLRHSERHR